jgi:hypothetical protein
MNVKTLVSATFLSCSAAFLTAQITVDDFNDLDVGDWGFFGGDNAGGGGGALDDRPFEGNGYLSTGWGSGGPSNGFFGGTFKNFDDSSQIVLPADPWINMYVYWESTSTSSDFTLEVTLREDIAGDGWGGFGGVDESFRFDTAFVGGVNPQDQWTLVSAPVSSLVKIDGTGDDAFTGNLDEIVLVIAGVNPADTTTVELDVDNIVFSSGAAIPEPSYFALALAVGAAVLYGRRRRKA